MSLRNTFTHEDARRRTGTRKNPSAFATADWYSEQSTGTVKIVRQLAYTSAERDALSTISTYTDKWHSHAPTCVCRRASLYSSRACTYVRTMRTRTLGVRVHRYTHVRSCVETHVRSLTRTHKYTRTPTHVKSCRSSDGLQV